MTRTNEKKAYFPLFVDLSERHVLVIGGGTIAERRIRTILPFAGSVTVVSTSLTEGLAELVRAAENTGGKAEDASGTDGAGGAPALVWRQCRYEREMLHGADLVLACTDDPAVNDDIHAVCRSLGIPVNLCNDKNKCDFYFPGIVRKENVVVGITASGTDHRKAKEIRERIEACLQEERGQ